MSCSVKDDHQSPLNGDLRVASDMAKMATYAVQLEGGVTTETRAQDRAACLLLIGMQGPDPCDITHPMHVLSA